MGWVFLQEIMSIFAGAGGCICEDCECYQLIAARWWLGIFAKSIQSETTFHKLFTKSSRPMAAIDDLRMIASSPTLTGTAVNRAGHLGSRVC